MEVRRFGRIGIPTFEAMTKLGPKGPFTNPSNLAKRIHEDPLLSGKVQDISFQKIEIEGSLFAKIYSESA
jgi:hypothetical protein